MKRRNVIVAHIRPGDVVVGLASFGQAVYEDAYNGGMGSNGLTAARHDVLDNTYAAQYPESFDPRLDPAVVYTGNRRLTETVHVNGQDIPIGKLILSPTRTYLPVLREMLAQHRKKIKALIHCTGGGQTKALKFMHNAHLIKDNLFPLPPLFELIQASSGTPWREMYQVFNMGHRMEIYTAPRHADALIHIAAQFGIEAQVIGRVEAAQGERVTVLSEYGQFEFV
jgi:phosphoribosylformylglycinamidine cyclo-ligase